MRTIYLRKEDKNGNRKVLLDMPYLTAHKMIRFPKYQFEEGLYLLNKPRKAKDIVKYNLTKDKIKKEDKNFYYFKFPFKADEVEDYAT